MTEIMQAVAAGQIEIGLNALPAAVKGFWRDIDAARGRREPIAAAQDREQFGRDWDITHARCALGRCVDQFAADAVADTADMQHISH